eukprot:5140244-Pleurochrysis_carterae.AAC.1
MPIIPAYTSTAAAYSAISLRTIGGSRVALVDSGSTRRASGDRSATQTCASNLRTVMFAITTATTLYQGDAA